MKLYSNINLYFVIWFLAISLSFYLGLSTLPHSGKFDNNFLGSLSNWDGGHFIGIAKAGYSEKFQYAFFPLYPLVIRLFNQITQNYLAAAILISLVSTFLGLHILYKLVAADFGRKIAEKTVLVFLFFPTSFFLLAAYSEGLFFFLTVLAFYFLKQNKLFWATIVVALVSATRLVGLAVVAGLWIDVLTKQGLSRKNWYILFAPLGFIVYSIFLFQQTGDPFYFITAENHWQRAFTTPGVGFWETLKNIINGGFSALNFNVLLDLLFAIFGVGFAIRSFRFLSPSFAFYSLLSVGIPLFTPTLLSMPRFLLPIFPIFILVALIKNHYLKFALKIFSLVLLGIFTALFAAGYWVS
ncbi:MAG: mannosyltransferase family protein [Candidatus Daviesbacteria bacterium]|nr:mannosyltransferase family protein [Candidatus Daviesbacteria bacterium]